MGGRKTMSHAENGVFPGMSRRKTPSHAENGVSSGTGMKRILSDPAFPIVSSQSRAAFGRPGVICGRKPVPDGGGEDKARFGCAGDDGSLEFRSIGDFLLFRQAPCRLNPGPPGRSQIVE